MVVGLIISILAVLFALYDRNLRNPVKFGGLEFGWLLLFVYLAIRYDYGNDYLSYLDNFQLYNSYSFKLTNTEAWAGLQSRGEYGWVIFNKICGPLGFFGMIILLTALFMVQIYYLIKKYVPPKWYWLAVFIFAFHPTFMVVGLAGMIRQWMALFLFVVACKFIHERRLVPYFLLILLATTFHTSAFFLFPIGLLAFIPIEKVKAKSLLWFVPFLIIWIFAMSRFQFSFINDLLSNDELNVYSDFIEKDNGLNVFGISSLITIGLPILSYSLVNNYSDEIKRYALFLLIPLLLIPFIKNNHLVGRLGVYFNVFSIIVLPNAFEALSRLKGKSIIVPLLLMLIVYYVYLFITHFTDIVWFSHIYQYHTIFSQPWQ